MHPSIIRVTILFLIAATPVSADDGWGSVSGTFLWNGELPEPSMLHEKGAAIKDGKVCAADDVYNDDLVVDKASKGIANIFIYLPKAPKMIHPNLKEFDAQVVFDQKNCMFRPHALLVRAGQSVEVLNSDPIAHNTHTIFLRNDSENLIIPPNRVQGKGTLYSTARREILPMTVQCDFHAWMKAYWLILDHPYAAITQEDGTFEIQDLPAGTHKFRVWHERVGYLERKLAVKIQDGETTVLKPMEYIIEKK